MLELRSIVIAGYGVKVCARNNLIVITKGSEKRVLAPSDIDQLILATSGISISTKALRLLMRFGVDVIVLDSRGYPVARLYQSHITRTVDSRRAQYEVYVSELATMYAKSFAESKIMNQGLYIKYLGRVLDLQDLVDTGTKILELVNDLARISGPINEARHEIMGIEARAARMYWGSIASIIPSDIGFDGRDQDSSDQLNTSLNYLYGVLYSEVFKALCLAGLDPYAGYLHTDRSGKPVLTFDFIEMFRVSAVDSLLVKLFREGFRVRIINGVLDPKSRSELISRYLEWVSRTVKPIDGRASDLRSMIRSFARRFAKCLRTRSRFRGFVERWWC